MVDEPKAKVLIKLTEKEDIELDDNGMVKSIKGTGKLAVINPSSTHRLWNLKMNVDKLENSTLNKNASKESLDTGGKWEFDYNILHLKEPILKLTEIIDASKKQEGTNHNYILNQSDETTISLNLENKSSKPIQNIKLLKQIPIYLKEIKISNSSGGQADFNIETRTLSWSCGVLMPSQTLSLMLTGRNEVKDSTVKSGNPVEVTYESEMNLLSGISPSLEALTDTMSGVSQEEDDSKPGRWNCTVEFSNESDFDITLKNVKVTKKGPTGEEPVVNLAPNAIVEASKSWSSNFSVDSPSVPSLNPKLDFTTNYAVPSIVYGKIIHQAQSFNVLETQTTKDIDPPIVKANANTDITIVDTIVNKGSAHINLMDIKDIIPRDFEPPTIDQIQVMVIDANGTQKSLDKSHATIEIVPADKDTTKIHTINLVMKDLFDLVGLNSKIIIKYPIIARNPQPNIKYEAPLNIMANTRPIGVGYPDAPKELPIIGIQYVKRKVKTMKAINPGSTPGSFNVIVKLTNSGGVELENITVVEELPKIFKAGDFKPADLKPSFSEEGDKAKLTWLIKRLDPEQIAKLEYTVTGTGEFPRTEPDVIIAEPDSLKQDKQPKIETGEGVSVQDQSFKDKNIGQTTEIMNDLIRKISTGLSAENVAQTMEDSRDKLLSVGKSSPVLHEMVLEIREIRKLGEKMMVGQRLDDLLKKISEWRRRLSN